MACGPLGGAIFDGLPLLFTDPGALGCWSGEDLVLVVLEKGFGGEGGAAVWIEL